MKRYLQFLIIMILLITGSLAGCSSNDSGGPNLPAPEGPGGGGYQGDQPEPPIPTPFADLAGRYIIDMQWEADGDLVVSTDAGMLLFTPYGLFKRNLGGTSNIYAIANNDSGRGMSYYTPDTMCNPAGVWDDQYVSGGDNTTSFHQLWFNEHTADIPDDGVVPDEWACVPGVTMGWSCPAITTVPCGYEYHPFTARTYILMGSAMTLIGDANGPIDGCGYSDFCPPVYEGITNNVILSYDQLAPFLDGVMNGPGDSDLPDGDWCYYTDLPRVNQLYTIMTLGGCGIYQFFFDTSKASLWDGVYPPLIPG
jgi:hypothetical protein